VLWFEPRGAGSTSLALRLDYRDSEGRNAGVTTTLFAGTKVFREDDLPDGKVLQKLLKGGSQRPPAKPPEPAAPSEEEEAEPATEAVAAASAETVEVTQAEQVPVAEAEIVVETEVVTELEPKPKPPAEAEDEPEPEAEPEPVDLGESGMDDLLGKLAELGPEAPPESEGKSSDDVYKKAGEDSAVVKSEPKKKQQKPVDDNDNGEMGDIFAKLKELDD
jgi:hypothetical protein